MVSKKSPNPIDIHVGSRLRMRRMMLSLSQEKLGDALGITFQQIQKYEKGINRIGAGRLQTIARILDVPISYFYEDAPESGEPIRNMARGFAETTDTSYVSELLTSSDGLKLTQAFLKIQDNQVRRKIVDLVRAIADAQPE
jgi:transcriptional regulator with XRE-family HTH domain